MPLWKLSASPTFTFTMAQFETGGTASYNGVPGEKEVVLPHLLHAHLQALPVTTDQRASVTFQAVEKL